MCAPCRQMCVCVCVCTHMVIMFTFLECFYLSAEHVKFETKSETLYSTNQITNPVCIMTTLMLCWEFHSQSSLVALSLKPPIPRSAQAANTIFGGTVVFTFKAQTHNQQRTCLNLSKPVKTIVHHKVSHTYTSKYNNIIIIIMMFYISNRRFAIQHILL